MADRQLSVREAALIAQARAGLQQKPAEPASPAAAAPPVRAAPAVPAESIAPAVRAESIAPAGTAPAPGLATAERIAALMAAARAETGRQRRRWRIYSVWVPIAFMAVTGMSTLVWLWNKL